MKSLPEPTASGSVPVSRTGCFVYRGYDAAGDLLYVGIADELLGRSREHRQSRAPWMHLAVRIEWALYDSREDAELVERRTIIDEQPNFNVAHNQRRINAQAMGHRRLHTAADWHHLAEVVRARRTELRVTQTALARVAGTDVATLRNLEHGTVTRLSGEVLTGLEKALRWRAGSVEAVLEGDQPVEQTPEDLMLQALEAGRQMLDEWRR